MRLTAPEQLMKAAGRFAPTLLVSDSTFLWEKRTRSSTKTAVMRRRLPADASRCQRCGIFPPLPRLRWTQIATARTMMRAQPARHVLVPIATGTEEMEAVIIIDVLRRAGASVAVASTEDSLLVRCSRGVVVVADTLIGSVEQDEFDLIACPGGMPGAERLRDCAVLERLLLRQRDAGKLYAAICATPAVFFQAKGLMDGRKGTSHPAFSEKLSDQSRVSERVAVDGTLTTSRGPGTAFEFALSLVKQLYGEDKAREVAGPMVLHPAQI